MLLRSFVLAGLVSTAPLNACDNLMVGDASRPDRASQRYIETLTDAVKQRFAAVAAASRCRQEDNRYSYELLLSKLNGAGQAILEKAASDGVASGRSAGSDTTNAADAASCRTAVDRLRAADDQLLLLSERLQG